MKTGRPQTALVLGGGFAGLSAAIYLAAAGLKVTLLEQAASLGGKAQEYRREGYRFDTGPHVFTLPQVLQDIYAVAGHSFDLELKPLEPICRYLFPSGRVWDTSRDADQSAAQLPAGEAAIYLALLREAERLYRTATPTFLYKPSPGLPALLRYGLRHGLGAYPHKRLVQLLDDYAVPGELKQFFLRFATYYGGDPYRVPAVLHNIAWTELGLGVYHPMGGIAQVIAGLAKLAQACGVSLHTGIKVHKLAVDRGVITSVDSSGGAFRADLIVSSLDVIRSYRLLGLRSAQERLEPSLSGMVLLLGTKAKSGLAHHNISFCSDYPAEFRDIRAGKFPQDPTLYISISSKTDPRDAPKDSENWFVMANAPALNGEGLDEAAYAKTIVNLLEHRGLLKRSAIRFMHSLGPGHLAQFAHRGSIYGAAPHSLLRTLRPAQRIWGVDNLVLAGGTVHPGGGMPLAMLSGKYAAQLGINLLRKSQ